MQEIFYKIHKGFTIAGLLVILSLAALAQKKPLHIISLNREMPEEWGQTVAVIITLSDTNKKEVKKLSTWIQNKKAVTIDIASLKPGTYTLKVIPEKKMEPSAELTADVNKKKGDSNLVLTLIANNHRYHGPIYAKKPVIYLYPEKVEDIAVSVSFKGELTETIPAYNGGWKVSATPDGRITNYADGMQYPYLFWEGSTYKGDWDMKDGFVVSGDKSRKFLEYQLREYNEFIDFWLPELQKNKYNLIHFAGHEYEELATLTIDPKPDAVLRVFMVFQAVNKNVQAVPQHFKSFVRKGFTVVEWGGMDLDKPKNNTLAETYSSAPLNSGATGHNDH